MGTKTDARKPFLTTTATADSRNSTSQNRGANNFNYTNDNHQPSIIQQPRRHHQNDKQHAETPLSPFFGINRFDAQLFRLKTEELCPG